MLADDGKAMLYLPSLNYVNGTLDAVGEQLAHPSSVVGLSDGGAHVGTICDVSFPTSLLQWWGRDRPNGRLPVELLVHKQTRATAETVGLLDRGLLAAGYRGDVNVIDFDGLRLHTPEFRYDLPAGGRRVIQRADGYLHTFVAGTEIREDGESTGATPGRLVRGAQPAPERLTLFVSVRILVAPGSGPKRISDGERRDHPLGDVRDAVAPGHEADRHVVAGRPGFELVPRPLAGAEGAHAAELADDRRRRRASPRGTTRRRRRPPCRAPARRPPPRAPRSGRR